ncbi:DNA repair protein XRCC4-like [Lineus longissimus]|uniref:DNA repair protein XRCC4-like n=1 Tax=Lineus longissimus TaxID=88925 RepID=UPI002B4F8637
MHEKRFCQISTSDGHDFYLLSTIKADGEDGISLVMCDGSNAWSGEVDGEDLVRTSRTLTMKSDEYLEQTCKALTGQHSAGLNFQYEVKKKGRTMEFSWKKMVSGIKFQLGSIVLRSEDDASEIIKELFDYCIGSFKNQNEQIRTLQGDTERLSSERTNALKRLEKFTAAKETLETDLYSKFRVIINSKKSKLRDVRQDLEEIRNNAPRQSTSTGKSAVKRQLSSSPESEAVNGSDAGEDDNESDYHSDDQTTPHPSKQMRRNAIVPKDEGSSLLFLGDEDEDNKKAAPLARRQRRQRESHKKQTPSKPVIPKVSSSKKPGLTRGSSGSSSGSTGARSSRRSGSQANADDLMDLM